MKKLITKKNIRIYNKTKKYNTARGGASVKFGVNITKLTEELDKKLKDIYNFFPQTNPAITKNELLEISIDGKATVRNIDQLGDIDKGDNNNEYAIIYPDYHGEYNSVQKKKCPDNVYICIFGLYNRDSIILNKGGHLSANEFMRNIKQADFTNIVKNKVILSNPEYDHKIRRVRRQDMDIANISHMECFAKGQWIFPGQTYYDMDLSMGSIQDGNLLETTYISEYNYSGTLTNITECNKKTINNIDDCITHYKTRWKYKIFFIDACRPNYTLTKNFGKIVTENNFLNHTFNICLYRILLQGASSSTEQDASDINTITPFFCNSGMPEYKELFYYPEDQDFAYIKLDDVSIPDINDNLHPYIPKLFYLYSKLCSLQDYKINTIKLYFEQNPSDLYFIVSLSFNKLKKFMFKLRERVPELLNNFIKYLRTTVFKNILKYNRKAFAKFFYQYKKFNPELQRIPHNLKLQKLIFDYLEICNFFNHNMKIPIKKALEIYPNIPFLDLKEYKIFKTDLTFEKTKINLVYYKSPINPFYDFTLCNEHLLSNIIEMRILKCQCMNKYKFKDIMGNLKKLKKINIDDSLFDFSPPIVLEELLKCFDNTLPDNELIIENLEITQASNNVSPSVTPLNFSSFEIIDLSFKNKNFHIENITINNSMERLSITGCFIKNINLKDNDIKYIILLYDGYNFNNMKEQTIGGCSKLKDLYISGINHTAQPAVPVEVFTFYIDNLNLLTILTLHNIKNINFHNIYIKTPHLEKLEIIDCVIENVKFTLRKIKYLKIIDSKINTNGSSSNTDINYDCEISGNKNLDISIANSSIINFNIYLKINLIKSNIFFKGSGNNKFERPLKIGKKKFYYIGSDNFKKLVNKGRNNKIILK